MLSGLRLKELSYQQKDFRKRNIEQGTSNTEVFYSKMSFIIR